MNISVVIITKNEEANIERCLRSVDWADEIIVLDSGSTDRTVEISQELGARVSVTADWPGFGPQKNRALEQATGDWVLSLDADEWVTPDLREEILNVISGPEGAVGFRVPRLSSFCGRFMRHSGWWPDYVTRLFRRGAAKFSDDVVHERVIAEGKVPDEDLALLAVYGEALSPVPIAAEENVDVGDDVVVVGAPYGRALSVSSGIVSQLEVDEQDPKVQRSMKTDAPIGYGASGGGVFEVPSGRLVGLVEGYRTAKVAFGGLSKDDFSFDVPMPGETFLAPPSKIRGFILRSGIGKLAGLKEGSAMAGAPHSVSPVAHGR